MTEALCGVNRSERFGGCDALGRLALKPMQLKVFPQTDPQTNSATVCN
jgi:hypothetical protein